MPKVMVDLLADPQVMLNFRRHLRRDTAHGCLLWEGAKNIVGQGLFSVRRGPKVTTERADLLMWINAGNTVPRDSHLARTCDHSDCVAPEHGQVREGKHREYRAKVGQTLAPLRAVVVDNSVEAKIEYERARAARIRMNADLES